MSLIFDLPLTLLAVALIYWARDLLGLLTIVGLAITVIAALAFTVSEDKHEQEQLTALLGYAAPGTFVTLWGCLGGYLIHYLTKCLVRR